MSSGVGRALTDQKKFEEAKEYLAASINEKSPNWMKSWSYAYLGVCYYATNNYEASKKNLLESISMDATKHSTNFAKKRLGWFQMTEYFDDWKVVETSNIRFHFQPGHKIQGLKTYCEAREAALAKNNEFFEAALYKKIDFFVWSKPKDGKKVIGRAIGFANSDLCIINARVEQTTGHEITHILSDYGIKPEKKNRLINEGVAVAFDLTNRDRLELAKSANRGNLGVKELMENADELPESVIYPIGGALIDFLRGRKSDEDLKSLIRNQTWENLIEVFGTELISAFERRIRNEK